jgi:hypothetical protein
MATYEELDELFSLTEGGPLRRRVAIATLVAADAIRQETDDGVATTRQRKRFAQRVLNTAFPVNLFFRKDGSHLALLSVFEAVYRSVIIANKGLAKTAILGATDAQIQTAVDAAIILLALDYPDPTV